MLIEDGRGTGNKARVDDSNRLRIYGVMELEELYANEEDLECYSIILDQNPTGVNDCILYIKNTDSKDMHLVDFVAFADGATEIYFQINNTGTATGATTVTPVNRNSGANLAATGTFQKGADLQLTAGSEVDRITLESSKVSFHHEWSSHIILPENGTFTVWTSADVTVNATMTMFYH